MFLIQIYRFWLVAKLKYASILKKFDTQDINNVRNFSKGLRNVKALKILFPEGYSVPNQTSNNEFLKKTCLTRCWIRLCILKCRVIGNIEIGTSCLSSLSEVFFKKKFLNSWNIQRRISTREIITFFQYFFLMYFSIYFLIISFQ